MRYIYRLTRLYGVEGTGEVIFIHANMVARSVYYDYDTYEQALEAAKWMYHPAYKFLIEKIQVIAFSSSTDFTREYLGEPVIQIKNKRIDTNEQE